MAGCERDGKIRLWGKKKDHPVRIVFFLKIHVLYSKAASDFLIIATASINSSSEITNGGAKRIM